MSVVLNENIDDDDDDDVFLSNHHQNHELIQCILSIKEGSYHESKSLLL